MNKVAELPATRRKWRIDEIAELFDLPFADLIHRAQAVHRQHFDPNAVQVSTLLSIKTGGCPEDCGYCPAVSAWVRPGVAPSSATWNRC